MLNKDTSEQVHILPSHFGGYQLASYNLLYFYGFEIVISYWKGRT
jgi:hypothetical protein